MRRLFVILGLLYLFSAGKAYAQVFSYNGICESGNTSVTVPGTQGSGNQKFQRSFPACTVTVYATGTLTPAVLFSDAAGSIPLGNPFTAQLSGRFTFFTVAAVYDIQLSGAGLTAPFIIPAVNIGGSGGGGGGANLKTCTGNGDVGAKITRAYNLPPVGGFIDCTALTGTLSIAIDPFVTMTQPTTVKLPIGTITTLTALNIPRNVTIQFPQGAIFKPSPGGPITFGGNIIANITQIFDVTNGTNLINVNPAITAYPQWWGAKGDGLILGGVDSTGVPIGIGSGCTGLAGSTSLTCATATFTQVDVGKIFDLAHAGASTCGGGSRYYAGSGGPFNCNIVGTIASVQSPTTITLSLSLTNSVTNEQFAYGTPDDTAVVASMTSQAKQINASGTYVLNKSNIFTMKNQSVQADGGRTGRFLTIGPTAFGTNKNNGFALDNGTVNVTFQNIQWIGTNELGELNTFGATPDLVIICTGVVAGLSGACNSILPTSISNLNFINCDFSHSWGIGLHNPGASITPGQTVTQISVINSTATYNSTDGFNVNPTDGYIMNNDIGNHNGTGGIETAINGGSFEVNGGQYKFNRNGGVAIGGFGDNTTHSSGCQIQGADISENGNGNVTPNTTTGIGLIFGNGFQNCTVTGNTFRHNHLIGLEINNAAQDRNITITGNIFSSNGIYGASGGSFGILVQGGDHAVISNNIVVDEAVNPITTATRTSNVVTVVTSGSNPFAVGNLIVISGTPAAIFDNGGGNPAFWTIASVIDGQTFTFAMTGTNTSAQAGGLVKFSPSQPLGLPNFFQGTGIGVSASAKNAEISGNWVQNNGSRNISLTGPFVNLFVQTNSNQFNDLGTDSSTSVTPAAGALKIIMPDISSTQNVCTTAASAGATCTTVVGNHLNTAPNNTRCTLDNTPNAQTGVPVITKVDTSVADQTTVTITAVTAVAAGGGSMHCLTNYLY